MSEAIAAGIWLVGCGNMGGAMLRRWTESGVDPARVVVLDPGTPSVPAGVRVMASPPPGELPGIVVLAIKPQQLGAFADAVGDRLAGVPLLVSILAGVEEAVLAERFAPRAVVRAMPNLSVAIGKGVVALHSDTPDAALRDAAERLMAPLGLVEWIADEPLFDAVTALSGCGPGFVYRFIDAMAEAGAALGLPIDQARRLALATVEGSGLLAAQADAPPAVLADRVASPGGSTREGLNVLDRDDALVRLMRDTLAASARRNAEMAAEARK
ncbi:pyrroline-5-carboxylate reductase family protein [Sphingomonas hengshuiensis]|uniref:Pyrroline-5-carboxylate reductase n=1 Tax=Sphingomonas hengshuiensis TaxID=1609977 RepID=A0A7U4LFR3_9SPHN|nr:pyrroline-5-carboxylate reductase [Sphingomonas hengshuiensis]AJP72419.1 pyrroline-5-carboxylate reductase [Sphingomonas hengshuiensis]